MFYDRFEELCRLKGVRPGRACKEMGVSRSLAAKWKSTGTDKPSADVLEKMSFYFHLSIDEILSADLSDEEITRNISFINWSSVTKHDERGNYYKVETSTSNPKITDIDLRIALYGDPAEDISAEDLERIRDYAKYIRDKRRGDSE